MTENQPQTPERKFNGPVALGLFLALLGGLSAIGTAVWITEDAQYLWALLLLGWGLQALRRAQPLAKWSTAFVGLTMMLLYAAVALVIWYVHDARYLWAMILVQYVAQGIVNSLYTSGD